MAAQKHSDSLEKIATEVRGCPLCRLVRTRKNAVPGEGLLAARIMFVGEAPGRSEDQKGKPFVGAAGRILDELLQKARYRKVTSFHYKRCEVPAPEQ